MIWEGICSKNANDLNIGREIQWEKEKERRPLSKGILEFMIKKRKKKRKESGLLTQSIMQLYYTYLWSIIFDAIIVKLTLETTIIEFAIDIVATKFTILQPYSLL